MLAELGGLPKHDQISLQHLLENVRKQPYHDPKAQELYERFLVQSFLLRPEQKDSITRLFVKHVAGVNMGDKDWLDQVGKNLNGVGKPPTKEGVEKFWHELARNFPGLVGQHELPWIIQNDDDGTGAFMCFNTVNNLFTPLENISSVAQEVGTSIHAWK